ncbi:MAG: SMC-Scp complex subunit ScpB [Planctomycetaceae bacterium]|nr:SMC-Scp complex subunit ScpB [Planctomycetaceae bacterium]
MDDAPEIDAPMPQSPSEETADTASSPADEQGKATIEAMLIASNAPLTAARMAGVAELPQAEVRGAITALNVRYEQTGAAFRIEEVAGGFLIMTLPEHQGVLNRLLQAHKETQLTQPAMETLAVVAYRQPVMRADIEAIRGVACGEVLRGLLDKQLVKIVGRAEVLGRPMLYGTTRRFLEVFGLAGLDDLPNVEELRSGDKPVPPKGEPGGVETSPEGDANAPLPEQEQPAGEPAEETAATASASEAPSGPAEEEFFDPAKADTVSEDSDDDDDNWDDEDDDDDDDDEDGWDDEEEEEEEEEK